MGLRVEFTDDGRVIDQYDDSLSRDTVVAALKIIDKLQCQSNGELYAPDITSENPKIIYEIEYAESQKGNRWKSNQRDKFGVGYDTVNCVDRKFYIWGAKGKYYVSRHADITLYEGVEVHFIRLNADHNQIIIVRDQTMRDPSKRELIEDQKVYKSTKVEDFWVIPRKYCETYNLQMDDDWIRDTEPNGQYDPRTTRGARISRELKNKKNELQGSIH